MHYIPFFGICQMFIAVFWLYRQNIELLCILVGETTKKCYHGNMKKMFGFRLKKLRERNDMRQIDLAQNIDVSQRTISSWEKDIVEPSMNQITQLAQMFDVAISYLLGYDSLTILVLDQTRDNIAQGNKDAQPLYENLQKIIDIFNATHPLKRREVFAEWKKIENEFDEKFFTEETIFMIQNLEPQEKFKK